MSLESPGHVLLPLGSLCSSEHSCTHICRGQNKNLEEGDLHGSITEAIGSNSEILLYLCTRSVVLQLTSESVMQFLDPPPRKQDFLFFCIYLKMWEKEMIQNQTENSTHSQLQKVSQSHQNRDRIRFFFKNHTEFA